MSFKFVWGPAPLEYAENDDAHNDKQNNECQASYAAL